MWTGPTVFKNQFDNLIKNQTLAYALNHLKVLYVVGFQMSYNDDYDSDDYDSDDEENEEFSNKYTSIAGNEIIAKTHIELYFSCTAFQNIAATIKKLHIRHGEQMYMFKPQAICMISDDINLDKSSIENLNIFPTNLSLEYRGEYKSFEISTELEEETDLLNLYDIIIKNTRQQQFQAYQLRMKIEEETGNIKLNKNIVDYLKNVDDNFFNSTLPFAQAYLDSYTVQKLLNGFIDYDYTPSKTSRKKRAEFNNEMLTSNKYNQLKIKHSFEKTSGQLVVEDMVKSGIITKDDIAEIKKVAVLENVDTTHLQEPEESPE
jgi:hypothetical protein